MQTIFITGGATGIGRAAVIKFLNEGYNVAFMDINTDAARKLSDEQSANSKQLLFIHGDTKVKADIEKAAAACADKFGAINAVFANAGIHRANTVLDISDEELDLMIQTNIYGNVNTLRITVPYLIKAGGGAIVINASDQVFVGKAHSFAYGMTKGALGQITKSLSIDLGPHHIRVNAVCAGTIHTPLVDNLFDKFAARTGKTVEEYWQDENALYARGKVGTPEEVAELVFFLASDKAAFCTGGHYLIDGGLVAGCH